jgi:GNAT superfamily N-acetyltransferase
VDPLRHRIAAEGDLDLLAEWNHQLIQAEGHRNPMTVPELRARMAGWIQGGYRAVLFEEDGEAVAYALYRELPGEIHLRQFFVAAARRRQGIGRKAMGILFDQVWPGGRRLWVEVLCRNETAVRFWRTMGYSDYALTLEIMPRP